MLLEEIDPLAWVKGNQKLFFPGGQIDVIRLIAYVMSDVLELGRGECRIVRRDGWWFVSSDVDWFVHDLSVRELFQRVVPAPQHGEHSMRAEVLINAYADDVFAVSGGEENEIKGLLPGRLLLQTVVQSGWTRGLLAFRLATDALAGP
ncbi:MAG: hypothetical protein KF782_24545 [Labilithrix sp.]|nr:hypothetical protein [Labilithrix sp.]